MKAAISAAPIDCEAIERELRSRRYGAVVSFIGTVRDRADDGAPVTGLSYEAHEPMAIAEFERIGQEARDKFGELEIAVAHRTGDLDAGEVAVVVCVGAAHRDAAFSACRYVIDELKEPRAHLEKRALRRRPQRLEIVNLELVRVNGDRNTIATLVYRPKRPRNVSIVVGHGYSSSKHNLDFLCNFLASHGYALFNLDFPGHKLGASGGTLRGLEDLTDAMRSVGTYARRGADGPLYYMGHSMGAMTAILTAALDPQAKGIVAITTGFGRPSGMAVLQSKGAVDFRSAYVDGVTLPDLMAQVDDDRFAQALAQA